MINLFIQIFNHEVKYYFHEVFKFSNKIASHRVSFYYTNMLFYHILFIEFTIFLDKFSFQTNWVRSLDAFGEVLRCSLAAH